MAKETKQLVGRGKFNGRKAALSRDEMIDGITGHRLEIEPRYDGRLSESFFVTKDKTFRISAHMGLGESHPVGPVDVEMLRGLEEITDSDTIEDIREAYKQF